MLSHNIWIRVTRTYKLGGKGLCLKNQPVYINRDIFLSTNISLVANKHCARVTRPRRWGFIRLSWCYVRLDNFEKNLIRFEDGEQCNKCHMFHPIFFFKLFFFLWTHTCISQIVQYRTSTYCLRTNEHSLDIRSRRICT